MLDRMLMRSTAPAWFFLLLFSVYVLTAHYGGTVFNDIHATAHASWSLATRGTLDLSGLDLPYEQAWTVQVGDAEYSDRFPGVILAGVPFYLLMQPDLPLVAPSALAAALASAIGVTAVLVTLRAMVPVRWAWAGAVFLALGSGVWAVGADGLYTHGVTTLWLGLMMAGLVLRGGGPLVPLAAAMAVLTRPHLAVALLVTAALLVRVDRRRALAIAGGAALGGALFLLYGFVLSGQWSATGLYNSEVLDLERVGEANPEQFGGPVLWRLENLAMAFVSPRVGLLMGYPTLLLVAWALLRSRRPPMPAVALAAGGLAYLLVAVLLIRVSGGSGFWGNRTLIEAVVLTWPLAVWVVAQHRGGAWWRGLLSVTVAWSVAFHSLGALSPSPAPVAEGDLLAGSSVMFWQVPAGVRAAEPWQLIVVVALTVLAAAVAWRLSVGSDAQAAEERSTADNTAEATSTPASSTSR